MAGVRRGADRNAPAGAPYGMLRVGLRTGVAQWLLERVPTPRRTPFTLGYLAVVGATTTFAKLAGPELVQRLQEASSSDGHNLLQHPLRALLLSGFWVAGEVWMPYLWGFAFTLAPLERRVGPARAAAVFAIGHVAATLLSQGVVIAAVATGRMAPEVMDRLDIGVSYGVLACLGAVAGLLPPRGRLLALGGAGLMIVEQIASDRDVVTAVGHPAAVLAGVALWRWLRRAERRPLRPAAVTAPAAAPAGAHVPAAR
ncbi:rhomboid-like protein [Streptomyces sp. NRRL S-350]|uniref:rhomboid-like protein n=1 Tax=Streptomyces sp. NRRL S-350 TaxID=1463902 RepID=UPI00131DF423|nr:rhomboid-like protein [Streptomyces sp. NRRL S-350]